MVLLDIDRFRFVFVSGAKWTKLGKSAYINMGGLENIIIRNRLCLEISLSPQAARKMTYACYTVLFTFNAVDSFVHFFKDWKFPRNFQSIERSF
jgi:hypothetical protein